MKVGKYMDVGSLNRRIEVWHKVKRINSLNQTIYEYVPFKGIWASIVPQTGKAFAAQAGTVAAEITHKIIIRHRNDLSNDMYIMYKGTRYDIKFILDPYMARKNLELSVTEVVE